MALPYSAVGWLAVCVILVLPDHTQLPFLHYKLTTINNHKCHLMVQCMKTNAIYLNASCYISPHNPIIYIRNSKVDTRCNDQNLVKRLIIIMFFLLLLLWVEQLLIYFLMLLFKTLNKLFAT